MKKTWQDFPEFYNNQFIKEIAENQKWTVSDKDKMPIDMHAFINEQKIWGMSLSRGYNPLVDLNTLNEVLPNAANNAYYLDALSDKFVVLDIEPKAPDIIKETMLKFPYLYGEISMSGKGYHLVFPLPDIIEQYPNAKNKLALKHEKGWFEILMNHMVTFTRNVLPDAKPEYSLSDFNNIFEQLAMQATETKTSDTQIDTINKDMPHFDDIIDELSSKNYKKTITDFSDDYSRYEFGMCGFYRNALNRLLKNDKYKDHDYTDEEKSILIYSVISEKLEYRPKHDEIRNNMPWLLYLAAKITKD